MEATNVKLMSEYNYILINSLSSAL